MPIAALPRLHVRRHDPQKFLVGIATTTIRDGGQQASMDALTASCGYQGIHRVYQGNAYGPTDYKNSTTAQVDFNWGAQIDRRVTHVSFDPNAISLISSDAPTQAAEVAKVCAFLDGLPAWKRLIINPWHEANYYSSTAGARYVNLFGDNFGAFRQALRKICDWIHFGTPGCSADTLALRRKNWRTCLLLTDSSWKHETARNDPENYWPGLDANGLPYIDVMGYDSYNEGSLDASGWDSPQASFGYPADPTETYTNYRVSSGGFLEWCETKNIKWWVIGELGCMTNHHSVSAQWSTTRYPNQPPTKADWLLEFGRFIAEYQKRPGNGCKLLGVQYFNASGRIYQGPYWWTNSVRSNDSNYTLTYFDATGSTLPAASAYTDGQKFFLSDDTTSTYIGYLNVGGSSWSSLGPFRRETWSLFNNTADLAAWAQVSALYGYDNTFQMPALPG